MSRNTIVKECSSEGLVTHYMPLSSNALELKKKKCPCVCHKKDMDKEEYQRMCWKCDGTGEIQS